MRRHKHGFMEGAALRGAGVPEGIRYGVGAEVGVGALDGGGRGGVRVSMGICFGERRVPLTHTQTHAGTHTGHTRYSRSGC